MVVEAFQWPSDDAPTWWRASLGIEDSTKVGNAREHDGLGGDKRHALIKTLEGVMRVDEGDWIILGIENEIYPCKPDIFAKTYEPVSDSQ
mgnify:CR=1 FL=1